MNRIRVRSAVFLSLAGLAAAGALWLFLPRGPAEDDRFLRHRGRLLWAAVRDSLAEDGRIVRDLRLTGAGGLEVHGRMSFPSGGGTGLTALVLQGGFRTGSRAIFYVPDPGRMVLASLDYRYRLPPRAGFFRVLRDLPRMRNGAEETVAGIFLLLDYLESLPEVDPARTVLVGGSLGAPFAATAGALDPRFEGVALLYGAADLTAVVEARLPRMPGPLRWASVRLLKPWLDPVDPVRYVGRIAPRPVLLVNGRGDRELPRAGVERLHAAAREPRTVVWVDTPHKVQGNPELTAPVAAAVWEWMEACGWRPPAGAQKS